MEKTSKFFWCSEAAEFTEKWGGTLDLFIFIIGNTGCFIKNGPPSHTILLCLGGHSLWNTLYCLLRSGVAKLYSLIPFLGKVGDKCPPLPPRLPLNLLEDESSIASEITSLIDTFFFSFLSRIPKSIYVYHMNRKIITRKFLQKFYEKVKSFFFNTCQTPTIISYWNGSFHNLKYYYKLRVCLSICPSVCL